MYYLSKNKIKIETSSLKGRFFLHQQPTRPVFDRKNFSIFSHLFVCLLIDCAD